MVGISADGLTASNPRRIGQGVGARSALSGVQRPNAARWFQGAAISPFGPWVSGEAKSPGE